MLNLIFGSLLLGSALSSKMLTDKSSIVVQTPESCEYDSTLDIWYFNSQVTQQIYTYSANGVQDTNKNFSDTLLSGPTGMVAHGSSLYVGSFTLGYVLQFNTNTLSRINSYDFSGHNPNGLCLDSSRNLLYVTDAGLNINTFQPNHIQGMWVINLTSNAKTEIFNSSTNLYPNGCTVKSDGTVYVVQTNVDTVGDNKLFTVTPGTWTITKATGTLGNWDSTADGIVFDKDGNLYVTSWGNFTTGSGYIKVYDGNSWSLAKSDLSGPADISYDSANNRICIPNYVSNVGMITDISSNSNTWNIYGVVFAIFIGFIYQL